MKELPLQYTDMNTCELDGLSAHIAILNRDGIILRVNKSWRNFGRANGLRLENDAIGVNYISVCESVKGDALIEARAVKHGIESVIRGEAEEFYQEYACHSPEEERWFVMRVSRIDDGQEIKLVIAHENITARRVAEEKLKVRSQELDERVTELNLNKDRLESLLQLSQTAYRLSEKEIVHEALEYAVRLTDSEIGYLHFVNPDQKTIQLVTWSDKTLEQCSMVHASHYPLDDAGIWADCVRLAKPVVHNDYQNITNKKGYPAGHAHLIRHVSIPVYDRGKIQIILGVGNKLADYDSADVLQMNLIGDQLVKILNRKRAEDALRDANQQLEKRLVEIENLQTQLREQAVRDYLTDLFNRRYLEETLVREIALAKRESNPLSIVIMDIDDFKAVNDSFGHPAGDFVLKELGRLLKKRSRSSDIACRHGGDEFVVVMPKASADNAFKRADEWRNTFAQKKFAFDGKVYRITLSIGIATFPLHASSPKGIFQAADQALYRSKTQHDKVTISSRNATGLLRNLI